MKYNSNVGREAVSYAQLLLDRLGLLEWATVACTYTSEDNMQLNIILPCFSRPIILGFATFYGVSDLETQRLVQSKVKHAILEACNASGIATSAIK